MTDLSGDEIDALTRIHRACRSLPEGPLVIVGGWAARLLQRHPLANPHPFAPLQTKDLDIATPDRSSVKAAMLGEQIEKEGFTPDYRSDDRPPVTRYTLHAAGNFELEFIAPLKGGESRRDGTPDSTVDFLGVSAQKLRHVELLLLEPCSIDLPEIGPRARFQVVNPGSFLLQRLLVLPLRPSPAKKGKDALYVHDALWLFTHSGRLHPEVVAQARRVHDTLTRKQKQSVAQTAGLLGDSTYRAVTEAARVAQASLRPDPPGAAAIALSCKLGLRELIGE